MSEVKVNKISPRTACGTVTLGDSGDTFTIPAGATITNNGTAAGFGATGAASWDTTVKTTGFTAVSGVGYFVNTTGGAVTVNLPAGTAGAVVAVKDYANTFDTNAVTLVQNGSDKIGGSTVNAILSTEGLAVTLVFIDSTQGWLVTDNGTQDTAPTTSFMVATGGTITTSGNDKIHTFTGPGTFTVCSVGTPSTNNQVSYLVVAGGAGGGAGCANSGGGGGAGGFREDKSPITPYTASPLEGAGPITVTATGFPITVGGGGAGGIHPSTAATVGVNSIFSTITSAGGGGGGNDNAPQRAGNNGGSGGGGGGGGYGSGSAGSGNTPPTSPEQGKNGGTNATGGPANDASAGGGGGATVVGTPVAPSPGGGGAGGAGATTSISASPTVYAGGGGGGTYSPTNPTVAAGGTGGGGAGGRGPSTVSIAGTANTGGGGGGSSQSPSTGAAGGSGIVIIRYKFQ